MDQKPLTTHEKLSGSCSRLHGRVTCGCTESVQYRQMKEHWWVSWEAPLLPLHRSHALMQRRQHGDPLGSGPVGFRSECAALQLRALLLLPHPRYLQPQPGGWKLGPAQPRLAIILRLGIHGLGYKQNFPLVHRWNISLNQRSPLHGLTGQVN